ncbi:MAG: hypothetical protein CME26_05455 [Gemmatimonadetes bacterium]|nr:hypothetical protein [Gemmatimonadota bacterium]
MNSPDSAQTVFEGPWDATITPLDTCGIVQLEGEKRARVVESDDPLAEAVIANYRTWWQRGKGASEDPVFWKRQSSILFDTVAVYLAFATDHCVMEDLPIRNTDDGFTREEAGASVVHCATDWRDLGGGRRSAGGTVDVFLSVEQGETGLPGIGSGALSVAQRNSLRRAPDLRNWAL